LWARVGWRNKRGGGQSIVDCWFDDEDKQSMSSIAEIGVHRCCIGVELEIDLSDGFVGKDADDR